MNEENVNWVEQKGSDYWIPKEKGDELVGVVIEVCPGGRFGKQLVIQTKDERQIRTPCHKVLQSRIRNVKGGQLIKIVYSGEEPPSLKGNKPTQMYDVFVAEHERASIPASVKIEKVDVGDGEVEAKA